MEIIVPDVIVAARQKILSVLLSSRWGFTQSSKGNAKTRGKSVMVYKVHKVDRVYKFPPHVRGMVWKLSCRMLTYLRSQDHSGEH